MAKEPKKQLSPERKELISKLIDEFDPKSVKDIEDMFKDMFSPMLQEMLEGELDDHLGYEKYEHSGESGSNAAARGSLHLLSLQGPSITLYIYSEYLVFYYSICYFSLFISI